MLWPSGMSQRPVSPLFPAEILKCSVSSCSPCPGSGPSASHFIHPLAYLSLRKDLVEEVVTSFSPSVA